MDGVRLEEIVEASLSVVFHLAKESGNRGLIRDVAVIRLLKRILSCGPPPGQSQAGENIIRYMVISYIGPLLWYVRVTHVVSPMCFQIDP